MTGKRNFKDPRKILNGLRMSPHVGFWTPTHRLQPKKRKQYLVLTLARLLIIGFQVEKVEKCS